MYKHHLYHKRNISNPWLAIGLAGIGVSIFILILPTTMGGIRAIIPSIWLSIPASIVVGSFVYFLFSRKKSRIILAILGLSMFVAWFFMGTGVRQMAALVVLPGKYGINIIALVGIFLLTISTIDYFLAHSSFAMVLIVVILLSRVQAWLTASPVSTLNSILNVFLALYVVVINITIGSVVTYEFLVFLFYEFYAPKRKIIHET